MYACANLKQMLKGSLLAKLTYYKGSLRPKQRLKWNYIPPDQFLWQTL